MLKLPGRGKEGINKSILSPYKNLFYSVRDKDEIKKDIKETVSPYIQPKKKLACSIRFENAEKGFGNNVVLKNLNLEIPNGEIFGVIGISGSGKTTLLRLIVGFYSPTKGSVTFNQKEVKKHQHYVAKYVGFATQDNSFYDDLTVEENVRFFGTLNGFTKKILDPRIENAIRVVELYEQRKVVARNLSGGMKRRLDLACALVNEPTVLILDEPTEDLDPILRRELLKLIKKINKLGTTIIFTTHLLNEAEYLCDNIAILSNQTVSTIGTPDNLKKLYKGGEEIHLVLEDTNRYPIYLKKLKSFKAKSINGRLVIYIPKRGQAVKILKKILSLVEKNKDKVEFADIRKPSLNEIFARIIKNAKIIKKK